ncbi:hypothetical protein GO988_21995 [Hymenobacter sp. HMF4947]|uniref:Uncharacterized protein n=1 Tax=Hymenobacter ginkgonis TaxID=2682976 RepID=A0A7K1TKW3_9BACT|nr:hypothetical protein [Hymenobacter ginkgonis]MVN79012.1 hypothetical protein [Hymenobacter ginkgonis]
MELDDLRRQWQQPQSAPTPTPLTSAELTQLVARQSGSIVEQLRRNARIELAVNYSLLVASLALAALASVLWVRLFGGLLALVALVCIYYFYRKLSVLRSMDDPAGDLRAHLVRITGGLRTLIRFYYRLTLAMIPVTSVLLGALALLGLLGNFTPTPSRLAWLLILLVGQAAVLYWPASRGTTWYLQRLYGQHLDRLERQLQELDDDEPGRMG